MAPAAFPAVSAPSGVRLLPSFAASSSDTAAIADEAMRRIVIRSAVSLLIIMSGLLWNYNVLSKSNHRAQRTSCVTTPYMLLLLPPRDNSSSPSASIGDMVCILCFKKTRFPIKPSGMTCFWIKQKSARRLHSNDSIDGGFILASQVFIKILTLPPASLHPVIHGLKPDPRLSLRLCGLARKYFCLWFLSASCKTEDRPQGAMNVQPFRIYAMMKRPIIEKARESFTAVPRMMPAQVPSPALPAWTMSLRA